MARKQQEQYGNSSISMLKGEDRVRKRPAVIFGSDDLEGCKHAVFEILSNAIDEAREGYGDTIIVTRYQDLSVEVEDFGRGCSASCTPAANTGRTEKTTSIPWASTDWAPAPPSTPPSISTRPSAGTDSGMISILKRAGM